MNDLGEPPAIQILEDLLGSTPPQEQTPAPAPASLPAQATAQPATAVTQAVPGTTAAKGPQPSQLPSVVTRASVINGQTQVSKIIDLSEKSTFEENLTKLLAKDIELAQHDRAMAIALFQTHLDRAEVLDAMVLSMPVATVIADNTGASLKSLELAMKAGERIRKAGELLVLAQRNGDAALLAALKIKNGNKGDGWGDDDLPAADSR